MQTSEGRVSPRSRTSPTKRVGLFGVFAGACALAVSVYSLSGQAVDARQVPASMSGATLSALHAAIPAGTTEQAPTF
jgi:hypothetical protein